MECFACDNLLERNYESLEAHMTSVHQIKKNRGFVLMFFVMDKSELDDWNDMFTARLEKLRMAEESGPEHEDDLAMIQSQIEFEDDSDDEVMEEGVKEEPVSEGRTIIHTDGEKLLSEETEESGIECIEILDSDDEEDNLAESSTADSSSEVLETKPDVSVGMNKINLAEKFSSINLCKLCYQKCGDAEKLKRHEEVVHKDDQVQLKLTHFTLKDLKFPCDRCPMKFLTTNILNIHSKLQHGIVLKESRGDRTCEICQKKVKYGSYYSHMKSHQDKTESCRLCYRKFREARALESHIQSIHQDEAIFLTREITAEDLTFSCHSCDLRFVSESCAKYHIRREHQPKPSNTGKPIFKCYFCEEKFPHTSDRRRHCWEVHGKKDETLSETHVRCMVCEKIVTKNKLSKHKNNHHGTKTKKQVYKCEFCPGEVFRRTAYRLHMRRVHKKKIKNSQLAFKCKLCYNQFSSSHNMKNHMKSLHAKESKFFDREIRDEDLKFPCTECPDRFVSEEILQAHTRKHQSDEFEFLRESSYESSEGRYKCKLCYTSFTYFRELVSHITSYHKEEINSFKEKNLDLKLDCPECELKFVSLNSLLYHRVRVHYSSDGTYCRLCDKTMKTKSGAQLHLVAYHSNELDALNKTFTGDEKDKTCDRCDKKFFTVGSLEYHRRQIHQLSKKKGKKKTKTSNVGEVKCRLCYKSFKKNIYRTQHVKNIHTSAEEKKFISNGYQGDLNYGCESCDLKFLTESLLQKHTQKEHSSKTSSGGSGQSSKQSSYCKLCYFDLKRPSALEEHRARVHTTAEEIATFNSEEIKFSALKFDCTICKKKLMTKSALKYHRQHVHRDKLKKDGDQEIPCEFCGKTFKWKNRGNLKSHIKNIHGQSDYDVVEETMARETDKTQPGDDVMSFFNML